MLQVGLVGALLLAVGGLAVTGQRTVPRAPARPLRALDPVAFSVLAAVADRLIDAPPGAPTPASLELAETIDEALAKMGPLAAAEVSRVLMLLESPIAGLLMDGRPRPFTALDAAGQDAVLEAWRTSRWTLRRQAYKALDLLVAAAYFGHPASYASTGYPGPPDYGNVRRGP